MVAHIWSKNKEAYLDFRLKGNYIKDQLDAEFIGYGDQYHYYSREMIEEDGETAKEKLQEIAKEQVDSGSKVILCVGYHGRKGPKEDPTIMGTAV